MKIFRIVFTVIAICVVVFNVSQLDFNWPIGNNDATAYATIFAALSGILILQIHRLSTKIKRK